MLGTPKRVWSFCGVIRWSECDKERHPFSFSHVGRLRQPGTVPLYFLPGSLSIPPCRSHTVAAKSPWGQRIPEGALVIPWVHVQRRNLLMATGCRECVAPTMPTDKATAVADVTGAAAMPRLFRLAWTIVHIWCETGRQPSFRSPCHNRTVVRRERGKEGRSVVGEKRASGVIRWPLTSARQAAGC
jgi:hypothetical protein